MVKVAAQLKERKGNYYYNGIIKYLSILNEITCHHLFHLLKFDVIKIVVEFMVKHNELKFYNTKNLDTFISF